MSFRPQAATHPQFPYNPSIFNILHQARADFDRIAGSSCLDQSTPCIEPWQHGVNRGSVGPDRYSIAIVDASLENAAPLVDAFNREQVAIFAFQTKKTLLEFVLKQQVDLGILVLHSKAWWKDELRLFCNSMRYFQENSEPEILCILNWPPESGEEEAMDRVCGYALRADVRHEW